MRSDANATWAVVVARVGPSAKSRLAGVLGPTERSRLAAAMLADVLDACAAVFGHRVLAAVDVWPGCALASAHGAEPLLDARPGQDMNVAVARGTALALARGAGCVLVLPGDVPLVSPAALRGVLTADLGATRSVVVAQDRAGSGTNALLLRPPAIIAPAFGPGSAQRHLARAHAAGAATAFVVEPRLRLDVDTPADLDALRAAEPAGATGRLLAEWVRAGGAAARSG